MADAHVAWPVNPRGAHMQITPLSILGLWVREKLVREHMVRTPEPGLVMDDAAQVEAYSRAGEEGGAMGGVYAFHAAHRLDVIRPGDTVVDLGCGPAHHLIESARLDPDSHFIGIDLSEEMLAAAQNNVKRALLNNVELRRGDMTKLDSIADASVDAVISSVALHHLPTYDALAQTLTEVRRILKPGGGIFLVDFCRLRAPATVKRFVDAQHGHAPPLHVRDYHDSMHAAFSLDDFRNAARVLEGTASLFQSFPFPYSVALKSPPRYIERDPRGPRLAMRRAALAPHAANDFKNLRLSFTLGGMKGRWL